MEQTPEKQRILIGTSGFSYDDWVGPVYPSGTKKADMLAYYANELKLNVVGLNQTFQSAPDRSQIEEMLSDAPEEFRFVVTVPSSLTHHIRDAHGAFIRDESAVDAFLDGLAPMMESGRLVCALARFPLKFRRSPSTEEHLKWLADKLARARLAVELDDSGWVAQSVFEMLKSVGAAYCAVDQPDLPRLAAFSPVATAGLACFMFHGKNRQWFGAPGAGRYDYLYSDSELRQFLEPVGRVISHANQTVIIFNNHCRGHAVANALAMKNLFAQVMRAS